MPAPMQNYSYRSIRASAVLTNSYVAATTVIGAVTDAVDVKLEQQLLLYVDFTLGSLTDAQIKVEFSDDNSDWYQLSFDSVAAGVDTVTMGVYKFTATGKYRIAIPIKDRFIRVSAIGTGTLTNSLMAIGAVVGT